MIQLPALVLAAAAAVAFPVAVSAKGVADDGAGGRTSRSRSSEVHCKLGTVWVPERRACVAPREGYAPSRRMNSQITPFEVAPRTDRIRDVAVAGSGEDLREGPAPGLPLVPRVPPFPGSAGRG